MDHSWAVVLISLFSWSSLYFLMCLLDSKKSYEWHCRMVTVVHASLIICLSYWAVFVLGPWPFTDSGGKCSAYQLFTMSVCLGYFIFDISWCLYFRTEGLVMLLHHTLSISGMSVSIYYGMYGTEMMATLLGTELTNPLLQLRWFLKECGRGDGLLADVVDHLFVILFGFIRLIIGSMLLYSYFHQPTDFLGRFAGVCIYSIGWLFWISVMQFAIKKYKKKLKRWRKAKGGTSNEKLLDDSDSERDLVKTNDELPESEISVSDKTENPTVLKSRSKIENSNSVSNGGVLNSSKCDSACVNGAEMRSPVNCISADSGRLKTD